MIKAADRVAAHREATELAGFTVDEAALYFGPLEPASDSGVDIVGRVPAELLRPWPTAVAQTRFLDRFSGLSRP